MRFLIYGAGVIGSLYAARLSEAGYETTLYARGDRLAALQKDGLLYENRGQIRRANVTITDHVGHNDRYDFILLPVRENQVHKALEELRENTSLTIVTMVNTLEPYREWETLCGEGRLLPAFPGAGGGFENGMLHASLTPRFIQPTVFGELDGRKTERLMTLQTVFKKAGIPCEIIEDMHSWQLCHLAMVVPLADAYYETESPETVWREKRVMRLTAERIRQNVRTLHALGIRITPAKMQFFRFLPLAVFSAGLKRVYQSKFGNTFMYRHAVKAPDEMRRLHDQFYSYLQTACNGKATGG